ncbi:MAG: glycosyltransferase family 2 protein [Actinobacteria bacterium]|nr:glycosyltransferase family 2 protein [Actinomycetota bacterium]
MSCILSIVIISFNTETLIEKCLSSIYSQKDITSFEVFVVDNGSTDKTVENIRKKHPQVNLIANKSNLGFAKASNQAIKKSMGKYILFLNSDVILLEDSLKKMIDFMDSKPLAGAISARLMDEKGYQQRLSRGYFPSLKTAFNQFLLLSNIFPKSYFFRGIDLETEIIEPEEVDWISGACMMVQRGVLEKTGLFDETFFMYVEDMEMCYRIKKCGFKIYSVPFKVIHLGGGSHNGAYNDMTALWFDNLHIFFLRENGWLKTLIFDLYAILGFLLRIFVYLVFVFKKESRRKLFINYKLFKKGINSFFITLTRKSL